MFEIFLISVFVLMGLLILGVFLIRSKPQEKKYERIAVILPKTIERSPQSLEPLISLIYSTVGRKSIFPWRRKTSERFSFEIVMKNGEIYFCIYGEYALLGTLEHQLYGQFPGCEIERLDEYIPEVSKHQHSAGFELSLQKEDSAPIMFYTDFASDKGQYVDPLTSIMNALTAVSRNKEDTIVIQYAIKMSVLAWKEEDEDVPEKHQTPAIDTNIRVIYISKMPIKSSALSTLQSAFLPYGVIDQNNLIVRTKSSPSPVIWKRARERKIVQAFRLCSKELLSLWHFPSAQAEVPQMRWIHSRKIQPPSNLPTFPNKEPLTLLGDTNFRGHKERFGIKVDDRRRHFYIIGKTGMGKSTLLENMIASDMQNGSGLAVIDPHGDLADAALRFVPKKRTNQVIIFDPSDSEFPVSFNMLECKNQQQRNIITSGLVSVFKKIFGDSWGPRLEYILRNTVLTLTYVPDATLLGIMRILNDKSYRKRALKHVHDSVLLHFWNEEFDKWQPKQQIEAIAPIQNKVGQFLSTSLMRNIFGQPKSSLDLRFAMDTGKIIICKLSKGKIGDDNTELLGSLLITKFHIDAMSRADIENANDRRDFFMYIDEFQNFATDSFAEILAEARKYRLNLNMANQYLDQMAETVASAVFGNVGSIVSFQVGPSDAKLFTQQFGNIVDEYDVMNLPKYKAYSRVMVDGIMSPVFSFDTLPPPDISEDFAADIEKLRKASRERYAKPRGFVEEKIKKWMES